MRTFRMWLCWRPVRIFRSRWMLGVGRMRVRMRARRMKMRMS